MKNKWHETQVFLLSYEAHHAKSGVTGRITWRLAVLQKAQIACFLRISAASWCKPIPIMRRHVLSFPPLLPNRSPIVMSAGELESGNAGEPAALIRQRYREASDIIKKGKMCCLFINDLDAGAGRMGGTTQYTVNNQMVNATLMNIADNPTNVQLPGM